MCVFIPIFEKIGRVEENGILLKFPLYFADLNFLEKAFNKTNESAFDF